MRLLKFIRIAATSIALLPWSAIMWVSDYVGQAVDLAKEAWQEAGNV